MASLADIAAKIEIQELESRYEWAVDEGRVQALENIFAPDATFWMDRIGHRITGRDQILAWFRDYCENWGWRNRRHYATNFHVIVDDSRASARFYYLATYEAEGASRLGWGHYDDSFVYIGERWWISEKRVHTVGVVYLDKGWAGLKELEPSPKRWE
jgi:ketosteroid isomerase-like protein